MHFLYTEYFLFLLPLILLIILMYFNYSKNVNFWPIDDLKIIFKFNSIYFKLYYLLIFIILIFFISIFAKPVTENIIEKNNKNWIDIQIVMDVSYSMIAEDLSPNRLSVAKDVIFNFLNNIQTDRVWIIVFAWKTFTSLPLSFDYNIIKKIAEKISVEIINQRYMNMQGTAVWDALILAADTFWADSEREKIIILLTDWEANKWIDPLLALKYIEEKHNSEIKIYTIWIGWDKPTLITIKDNFWRNQQLPIWAVDEKTLKIIAEKTDWRYFRAWNRETLEDIFTEISKLEKKEIETEVIKINKEKYYYFLYLLILFFILFLGIKYWKRV